MGVLRCLALRFFYILPKMLKSVIVLLWTSWVCESCQLDTLLCISSSQLYTTRYFFCSDSCRSRSTVPQPHSHEPFILLPRLTWAKVQKTSETKIGTQTIYSEITIREASIKMRETYKVLFFPFFLFVDVPAFWGGFVFLKVLRSNKREATVGI